MRYAYTVTVDDGKVNNCLQRYLLFSYLIVGHLVTPRIEFSNLTKTKVYLYTALEAPQNGEERTIDSVGILKTDSNSKDDSDRVQR